LYAVQLKPERRSLPWGQGQGVRGDSINSTPRAKVRHVVPKMEIGSTTRVIGVGRHSTSFGRVLDDLLPWSSTFGGGNFAGIAPQPDATERSQPSGPAASGLWRANNAENESQSNKSSSGNSPNGSRIESASYLAQKDSRPPIRYYGGRGVSRSFGRVLDKDYPSTCGGNVAGMAPQPDTTERSHVATK